MSEQTEPKLYCGQEALKQYREQEAEIRLILKVKQNSDGNVTGYVYSFDINNYQGLIHNATQLAREYDFHYSTDQMLRTTIDHILKNRIQ
jgi:hypothetical protein